MIKYDYAYINSWYRPVSVRFLFKGNIHLKVVVMLQEKC